MILGGHFFKRSSNCVQNYKILLSMPNLKGFNFRKNGVFMFYNIFFAKKTNCITINSYLCIMF